MTSHPPPQPKWVTNSSTGVSPLQRAKELAGTTELAYFFAIRDLKLRYRQTFLGLAWAVIQPIIQAAIALIILGRLLGVPSDNTPYMLFAFTGFLGWTYILRSFTAAADSLVSNPDLLAKIYFPRLHAPLGSMLPGVADLAAGAALLIPLMAYYRLAPGWQLLTLPFWILFLSATAALPGILLAAVNIHYRDVKHIIPFIGQVWFYITPVAYASSIIPSQYSMLYRMNPATTAIDGFRWALLDTPLPNHMWISALTTFLGLAIALKTFHKLEKSFADVI